MRNEMKATDLTIGDWVKDSTKCYVRFDGIGCSDYNELNREYGNPIRCADEDDRYVGIINGKQNRRYNEHLADLEPIPLTEDILSTNGWYKLKELGAGCIGYGTKYGDYTITYISHYGLPVLTIEQDNLMKHRTCVTLVDEVYDVHSLQNAYRMCGLGELADMFVVK